MPKFHQTHLLPHKAEQMLSLVLDIERYPEFLPWCRRARVLERDEEEGCLLGELSVGYGVLTRKFTSRVTYDRTRIDMRAVGGTAGGMFSRFHSWWQIEAKGADRCRVEFFIEFQVRLLPFMFLLDEMFSHAAQRMVESFEQRARDLYGDAEHALSIGAGLVERAPSLESARSGKSL